MYLNWNIASPSVTGTRPERFRLDKAMRPVAVWMYAVTEPLGQPLTIDINDDGISILSINAALPAGVNESRTTGISSQRMEKNSVITLDIDQLGSGEMGKDITVQLDLVEI